jgi:hypothetical protein
MIHYFTLRWVINPRNLPIIRLGLTTIFGYHRTGCTLNQIDWAIYFNGMVALLRLGHLEPIANWRFGPETANVDRR